MAEPLGLDVSHDGMQTTVVVSGELDASTAPALDSVLALLAETGTGHVVLDLVGLDFADSYGLEPVLRRRDRFAGFVIYGPTRPVRHLLSVLNLAFSPVVETAAVA